MHDFAGGATDRYVTEQINNWGTYITEKDASEDANTPLVPFYRDNTNFWDSEGVRSTTAFGYVYPETQNPQKLAGANYRQGIIDALRRIYPNGSLADLVRRDRAGSNAPVRMFRARAQTLAQVTAADAPTNAVTLMSVVSQATPQAAPAAQVVQELPKIEVPPVQLREDQDLKKIVPSNIYLEWLVEIKSQKHAMGGEFTVHVFLGPVEEDNPALYPISPNHVGTFSTFGTGQDTGCIKCQKDQAADQQVTGQIPLTIALVERYFAQMLGGLQPDVVVPYLQQTLHWRVIGRDGIPLDDRSQIPDLAVAVISNEVEIPEDQAALPVYSPNVTVHPDGRNYIDGPARIYRRARNLISLGTFRHQDILYTCTIQNILGI